MRFVELSILAFVFSRAAMLTPTLQAQSPDLTYQRRCYSAFYDQPVNGATAALFPRFFVLEAGKDGGKITGDSSSFWQQSPRTVALWSRSRNGAALMIQLDASESWVSLQLRGTGDTLTGPASYIPDGIPPPEQQKRMRAVAVEVSCTRTSWRLPPNRRLELAPPVVVELHLMQTNPGRRSSAASR